ncbi:MAG TPA: DUF2357 domain-containing protein, partial [Anaerolineae bacterium]
MAAEDLGASDVPVLRRLVGLLMTTRPTAPDHILDRPAQGTARATYFLLNTDDRGDVETLMRHTLDRLLQQLSHNTQQWPVQQRERVRGRIMWPATYKARFAQDYDPTRFVCREVRHAYDTPENQLLKYMLHAIDLCLDAVPLSLLRGACYFPDQSNRPPLGLEVWVEQLKTILIRSRRHTRLREVSLPLKIDEVHLLRARMSRVEEYASVARLYENYQAIVLAAGWDGVAAV